MTETRPLRAMPQDEQDGEPTADVPSDLRERKEGEPSRSRRRVLRWLLPIVLLAAIVLTAWLLTRDADATPTYLTEQARTASLQDRVEAAAVVAYPSTATTELRSPVGGTLTGVHVREGDRPGPLAVVAEVNELPLVNGRNVAWRREVASRLMDLQRRDGSWENDNSRWWEKDAVLVTSYAVLSLEMIYSGL